MSSSASQLLPALVSRAQEQELLQVLPEQALQEQALQAQESAPGQESLS